LLTSSGTNLSSTREKTTENKNNGKITNTAFFQSLISISLLFAHKCLSVSKKGRRDSIIIAIHIGASTIWGANISPIIPPKKNMLEAMGLNCSSRKSIYIVKRIRIVSNGVCHFL